MFRTYDLEPTWRLEQNLETLRGTNNEIGHTIKMKELDEIITFRSLPVIETDEPVDFME